MIAARSPKNYFTTSRRFLNSAAYHYISILQLFAFRVSLYFVLRFILLTSIVHSLTTDTYYSTYLHITPSIMVDPKESLSTMYIFSKSPILMLNSWNRTLEHRDNKLNRIEYTISTSRKQSIIYQGQNLIAPSYYHHSAIHLHLALCPR